MHPNFRVPIGRLTIVALGRPRGTGEDIKCPSYNTKDSVHRALALAGTPAHVALSNQTYQIPSWLEKARPIKRDNTVVLRVGDAVRI